MVFLLFLFNDPLYTLHVFEPSFITFAITEFFSALFMSALLIYWLRELAGFKPQEVPKNANCLKKLVLSSQGWNKCAMVYLCLFFIFLVVDFMVLNCFYYIYLKGDPSLAGRFDFNNTA